jgi:polysaccharide pyruvyl transferase CsaB
VGLAALAALGLGPRLAFDRADRAIELVVDLRSLEELGGATHGARLFQRLAETGVTAVAIRPRALEDLLLSGEAARDDAPPGLRAYRFGDQALAHRAATRLARFHPVQRDGLRLVLPAESAPAVEKLRVLFPPPSRLGEIGAAGLRPVMRLKNSGFRENYPDRLLEDVPEGALLIFDDKEALGYPAALTRVGKLLAAKQLSVGLVEFAGQRGVQALATRGAASMQAVHSIPADEMEKYPLGRVLPRWARAAKERRVRVFYLNPFPLHNLPRDVSDGLEANLAYFRDVVKVLAREGFHPGQPLDPTRDLALPAWPLRALACLAGGLLLAWLLAFYRVLPPSLLAVGGLLVGVGGILLGATRGGGLPANLLALAAACAAPAAAILEVTERAARSRHPWRAVLYGPLLVFGASVAAGAVVFVLLSSPGYLTRSLDFRGVKLVYLGPLALVGLYHLRRVPWYHRRLRAHELGLLGLGALLGIVYIARSGNFSPIPASAGEHKLRDTLERVLPYRPRTKEVAVGYPALGFLAAAASRADAVWVGWAGMGAAVAGVSATNSFCHLKTPFAASFGRGLTGVLFGLPIGLAGAALYLLFLTRRRRRTWVLAGYAGHGNFGDEWITRELVRELDRRRPEDIELVVLTDRPEAAREDLGATGVGRFDLPGVLEALRHADLFATGPGGLVQDRTSPRTPAYYLGLHALAHLVGVPRTAFLGEGFGPLRGSLARRALRYYTGLADACLVRDEASLTLAAPGAVRVPDASLWGSPPEDRDPGPATGPLGLVLRDVPGQDPELVTRWALAASEVAAARGLAVRLLPAHPERDRPRTQALLHTLEEAGHAATETTLVKATPEELSALVCMRLHGCIWALEYGIPLLALEYDPKVTAMLDTAHYPFRCPPEASPEAVKDQVEALLERRDEAMERAREARRLLRLGQEEARRRLDDLLGPPRPIGEPPQEHAPEGATSASPAP